jgi:2-polyprenyl-6-methoxyphenol hydroxylase-like FAD-dependent oxidoreductase
MDVDVVIMGGGLAGSGLATVLAKKGVNVRVIERETKFRDRIRGENMLPWGVAAARRLGLLDDLVAAGGRRMPYFNIYVMGMHAVARSLPETTPGGDTSLNMYHPDLQEAVLAAAVKAGADVRRGVTVRAIEDANGKRTLTYEEDGKAETVTARLVVAADGRTSKAREWGGFTVRRDPLHLRIAGAMMEGTSVPDDGTFFAMVPGSGSFLVPLGGGRTRTYFIYPGATGDRKLSGKEKVTEFMDAVRATLVPAAWYEGATQTGPLAEFEGADHWVESPAKAGLALIGDAAGCTDPSWGSGLSKTLVDVENLSKRLVETDDWDAAAASYAKDHDDMFGKLHAILAAMTTLFWTPGPEADGRRMAVSMKLRQDPASYPDATGLGPFGPSDEPACRRLMGLE